jgi:hypothetical protein
MAPRIVLVGWARDIYLAGTPEDKRQIEAWVNRLRAGHGTSHPSGSEEEAIVFVTHAGGQRILLEYLKSEDGVTFFVLSITIRS